MIGREFIEQRDADQLMGQLRNWERSVEDKYKHFVTDEHFDSVTRRSINMNRMLDALPQKERQRMILAYQHIVGLTDLQRDLKSDIVGATPQSFRDSGIGRFLKRPEAGRKTPVKLNIDPDLIQGPNAHPAAFIINRMTPQLDIEAGTLSTGANILRADYIQEVMNAPAPTIGKKVLIFDTETAGLTESSGIHQLSYATREIGAPVSMDNMQDLRFRTHQMQRGYIAGPGGTGAKSMQDVIADRLRTEGKTFANLEPGSGADFVRSMRPFLEQVKEADYIVGHNVQFDLDQIFRGSRLTAAYQEDTDGFKSFLDEVSDATLGKGKIRDTYTMSQQYMPDLGLSPEFMRIGKARTHSIENILLQTNLFDLVKQNIGGDDDAVRAALGLGGGSLHSADIDTFLTDTLFEGINQGSLRYGRGQGLGRTGIAQEMRQSILKSGALTPITNLADINLIDRGVFAQMLKSNDGIEIFDRKMNLADLRAMGDDAAYDYIRDNNILANFHVTPLEQEMMLTRGNITTNVKTMDEWTSIFSFGQYRDFSGMDRTGEGYLNRARTLFKRGVREAPDTFVELQENLARAGMPFANISEPERHFTHAISLAAADAPANNQLLRTLAKDRPVERELIDLTDDLGISRFFHYENSWMTRSGSNINLNAGLLREAGLLNPDDNIMLGYSAFQQTDGTKMFNLQYKMSEEQATGLANYMKLNRDNISNYFADNANIDEIIEALPRVATERGVGIGALHGRAAERAYEAVKSFNVGQVSDYATIPLRAGLMNYDDNGIIRTGAWVSDKFASPEFMDDYWGSMNLAKTRLEDLRKLGSEHPFMMGMMRNAHTKGEKQFVAKALRTYDSHIGKAPWALGAAAIAGVGYYFKQRHDEKSQYSDTIETQDFESRSYGPMGIEQQAQVYAMRQGVDPLKTAGVVKAQHNRRIGHTQMGNGKNMHLYGQ